MRKGCLPNKDPLPNKYMIKYCIRPTCVVKNILYCTLAVVLARVLELNIIPRSAPQKSIYTSPSSSRKGRGGGKGFLWLWFYYGDEKRSFWHWNIIEFSLEKWVKSGTRWVSSNIGDDDKCRLMTAKNLRVLSIYLTIYMVSRHSSRYGISNISGG